MTTKTNKSSNHCFIICCGQGLVVSHCLIICCGQGLVASYCLIICCGQGLVASYCFITFATKTKFHTPKRAFCARLPGNFIEQASKTNVSREASSKFHRTKLPKQAFRARLPPNFTEQSFQNERFVRGLLKIS